MESLVVGFLKDRNYAKCVEILISGDNEQLDKLFAIVEVEKALLASDVIQFILKVLYQLLRDVPNHHKFGVWV